VRFRQAAGGASNYLAIQAIASRSDSSGIQAQTSQFALPLSVLTHQGQSAPPLILSGCLNGTALNLHVRPLKADSDLAGDAAWFNEAVPCPAVESLDLHGGRLTVKDMPDDLWSLMFSLSRDEFVSLAEEHHSLPERERIYWVARDDDLRSGHWSRSLGEPDQPVALYLPDELACPPFSAGVRIYGVVFIDSNCPDPIADHNVEVFGSLIVNGNMNVGTAQLKLNHIQIADSEQSTLRFPILRSVWVPGSWRDF
jgi:hypothetical protein